MLDRLRAALHALRPDQRRVVFSAAAVLGSLLLPWYTKTTVAATPTLQTTTQHKLAILVPSLVEASIMLVAVGVIGLMLARGMAGRFFLPVPDRLLVMAAGGWTFLLVFYRFVDQPHGVTRDRITTGYELSWGIFFGLIAAGLLFSSGWLMRHDAGAASAASPDEPYTEPHGDAAP
jgi:hypothetical protein